MIAENLWPLCAPNSCQVVRGGAALERGPWSPIFFYTCLILVYSMIVDPLCDESLNLTTRTEYKYGQNIGFL